MPAITKEQEVTIRSSFDVMDDDKIGVIDVGRFQTLWLALGYGKVTMDALHSMVESQDLTIEVVLRILSTRTTADDMFSLPVTNHTTAQDLIELAKVAGESLTMEEAQAMMDGKEAWSEADLNALLSQAESNPHQLD
jgi:Ca2+-binding EF-hand superfamily protein